MKRIVDTNVPLVANGAASQASVSCQAACARALKRLMDRETLVLDDGWHILGEYKHRLRSCGQPGVGDEFLRWVLTHLIDESSCELVRIKVRSGDETQGFAEFPLSEGLASFDLSDRKFAAVAIAHPEHPPILNAVDSDWWLYRQELARHSVRIDFVCPDAPFLKGDSHGHDQL